MTLESRKNYNGVSKNRHPSGRLSNLIWEKHNGKIPEGNIIHHVDGDIKNDRIENLKCITRSEHTKTHPKKVKDGFHNKILLKATIKKKKSTLRMAKNGKSIFIVAVFALIFMISMVSAFEFDNVKTYDPITKEVTIDNLFGLGSEIANIRLDSPLVVEVQPGYQKVAEFTISQNYDGTYTNALDKIELTDVISQKSIERVIDYKYKTTALVDVPTYTEKCKTLENSTKLCHNVENGTTKEEQVVWKDYNGTDVIKGDITIGLFTKVEIGDYVDWIPTYYGVEVEEWAVWTAALNVGLGRYYKYDEGSGSNVEDSVTGNFNTTATGSVVWADGIINSAIETSAAGEFVNATIVDWKTNFSISHWVYYPTGSSRVWTIFTVPDRVGIQIDDSPDQQITFELSDGTWDNGVANVTMLDDTWVHFCATYDGSSDERRMYINGSIVLSDTVSSVLVGDAWATLQRYNVGSNVTIDEVGIWNRTLTSAECIQLYNEGNGIQYTTDFALPVDIDLNAPVDVANLTDKDVEFNCTPTVGSGVVQNVSLIINSTYNITNSSPINNTPTIFDVPLADGGYNWTCEACDATDDCINATTQTFTVNTAPTILITSPPVNNSNYTTNTIFFNATANQAIDTWIINYNGTNVTMSDINTTVSVVDGNDYQVLLYANNSDSGVWGLNDTYYISVDATLPSITLTSPNETYASFISGNNVSIMWNVTDDNLASCWYDYNTTNTTVTCADNVSNLTITDPTNKNLTFWANDTVGNYNSKFTSWDYLMFKESESYSTPITGGATSTFTLNIITNGTPLNFANLWYNGTAETGSISASGNNYTITKTRVAPTVSTDTNLSFYWSVTVGNQVNFTANNQTVTTLAIANCSWGLTNETLFNFTMVDEESQTEINEALHAVTPKINLQIYNPQRTVEIINYSSNFSTNPFGICLNTNLSSGEVYAIDVQVEYNSNYTTPEFYHIQNETLTNADFPTNISLYALNDSKDTIFELLVRDSSYLSLGEAIIYVDRKYVEEGVYKTVEIPKTNTGGTTVAHLQLNDVVYRFRIYKFGELIKTVSDVIPTCLTTLTQCKIDFDAFSSGIAVPDFTTGEDFNFTLGFNETSRVLSSVFVIPSGTPETITLNVTKQDALSTQVCTDSITSSSGTLSCIVPASFGNETIKATILKGTTEQAFGMIKLDSNPSDLYGNVVVFFGLFMMLSLIGMGVSDNPVITGLLLMVGVILLFGLNIVANNGFVGATASVLYLMVAIIILLIKGARRS